MKRLMQCLNHLSAYVIDVMPHWTDEIDRVTWNELESSYGTASGVPRILRTLGGDQCDPTQSSVRALYSHLNPDGDLFDGTLSVLPILFDALQDTSLRCRPRIINFIGSVAISTGRFGDELTLRANFVATLKNCLPLLHEMISEQDDRLRMCAVYASANIVALSEKNSSTNVAIETFLGFLLARLELESKREILASILCGIVLVASSFKLEDWLTTIRALQIDEIARVPMLCVLGANDKLLGADLCKLRDYLCHPPEFRFWENYTKKNFFSDSEFPWIDGRVDHEIVERTVKAPVSNSECKTDILTHAISELDRRCSTRWINYLDLLMPRFNFLEIEASNVALTAFERAILFAVVSNDKLWESSSKYGGLFQEELGIPDTIEGRMRVRCYLQRHQV